MKVSRRDLPVAAKRAFGLDGGVLVSNPIPEEHSMDEETVRRAIEESLEEMAREGISGKAVTPYLLERVKSVTGGKSLESNIALILGNARVGALLAGEICRLRASGASPSSRQGGRREGIRTGRTAASNSREGGTA